MRERGKWEEDSLKRTLSADEAFFFTFILKSFQTYTKVVFTENTICTKNSCTLLTSSAYQFLFMCIIYFFPELIENKWQIRCPFISKNLNMYFLKRTFSFTTPRNYQHQEINVGTMLLSKLHICFNSHVFLTMFFITKEETIFFFLSRIHSNVSLGSFS